MQDFHANQTKMVVEGSVNAFKILPLGLGHFLVSKSEFLPT